MKVLVTGGHVTAAIPVVDELVKENHNVVFVGRRIISKGDRSPSFEYQEIESRGIKFINLRAGRLTRLFSLQSIAHLLEVPLGFIRALRIVWHEKPDRIISFGGYLALPIAYAGFILGVPVYTHEQTIEPGLANKLIANIAKKVFISFESSSQFFDSRKIIATGNPIRSEIFKIIKKPFELPNTLPVIYVTGGSLGAHSINKLIKSILPELLEKYIVVHQTGQVSEYSDFDMLNTYKKSLPALLVDRYFLTRHVGSTEIGYLYDRADVVVSRAGANTFFELAMLKKPAVLIPLPWSARGEQAKHAKLFADRGCGLVFEQSKSAGELFAAIESVYRNRLKHKKNFHKLQLVDSTHAAKAIIQATLS